MEKKNNKLSLITNGFIKENPVLKLVLGTCPTLAVTSSAFNGFGMGVAATFVLICSNVVISALRKIIPDKVRIPAFITIIAGFVTVVQMLVKAFSYLILSPRKQPMMKINTHLINTLDFCEQLLLNYYGKK